MTRKRRSRQKSNDTEAVLPDGCHHYQSLDEVPWDIQKYFAQRYSLFSEYDQGIWMTDDAWFGVTPEPVADKIAQHLAIAAPSSKDILIDVFGGAGGNAIAFARSGRWRQIHVIERDGPTLACARHNAEVYGVESIITWYHGDSFEILQEHFRGIADRAVLFASPPWGGPGYRTDKIFDLSCMQPYSLNDLMIPFQSVTNDVVLFLPRTSDLRQFVAFREKDRKLTGIHYCMEGASKALCIYFGDLTLDVTQQSTVTG